MENNSKNLKERKTLILQIQNNPYFEEAHLIFKNDRPTSKDSDMVKEANRIVAQYAQAGTLPRARKEKRTRSPLFYFIAGMLCALLFFALSLLCFFLIGSYGHKFFTN
ncbi:MAG: hypothetical protein IJX08_05845 [Clostridia bacterium]|nr:hypothetical protein [Clostridia bacterium]